MNTVKILREELWRIERERNALISDSGIVADKEKFNFLVRTARELKECIDYLTEIKR